MDAKANGVTDAISAEDARHEGVSEVLAATASRKLKVKRIRPHGLGRDDDPVDYVGQCGFVRNRDGFEEEIRSLWGGGVYEVSGKDHKGVAFCHDDVVIPGDSLPLAEDDDDAPPPRSFMPPPGYPRAPFGHPAGFPPSFPGAGFPPPGPGAPGLPGWYQAYYPETQREAATLRERLAEAEKKLHAAELEAAQLRRELEQAKAHARDEQLKREFNERIAQITAAQPKGPDPTLRLMELMAQERIAKAGKDEQAAQAAQAAQATLFQTLMQQQAQTLQTFLAQKGSQQDMLAAMAALQKIQGNPIEQFTAMAEAMERLKGRDDDDEDDDEEEGSVVEEAMKALPKLLKHGFTEPAPAQQAAPVPVQQQVPMAQPAQLPQNGNGAPKEQTVSTQQLLRILEEILRYHGSGMPADQAAEHLKTFCRQNGVGQAIPLLSAETTASLHQKVKAAHAMVPSALPLSQSLGRMVQLFESQPGAAWATALIERLKA